VLSGRVLCDRLITCTEESYDCLSVMRVVCCQVGFVRRAVHLYRGVLWMSVCCKFCVLSGGVLCDWPISCKEESYGYLSVVSVVCCQLHVCATGCSLVQSIPIDVCLL